MKKFFLLSTTLCVAFLLSSCSISISTNPTNGSSSQASSSVSASSSAASTSSATPAASDPSSSESTISEPTVSPQATHSPESRSESELAEIDDQTLTTLKEISRDGYAFYKECYMDQIGSQGDQADEFYLDLDHQFFRGEQQYIAVAPIQSKEDFLALCAKLYSDNFIDQNIACWFDDEDALFEEHQGTLYYRVPSGTGLVSPLADHLAEIEYQTPDKVSIYFPFWDSRIQRVTNGGVQITLVKTDQVWKIDKIEEKYE